MSKFEIEILNYFSREELSAEIYYDRVQWVEIFLKKKELMIKFYPHPKNEFWEFSYEEASEILKQAKSKLLNKKKSSFCEAPANVEQINQQGQRILEEILAHPQAKVYSNRFGGKDIFEPSGRGARYDDEGNFMGFLQVRQLE